MLHSHMTRPFRSRSLRSRRESFLPKFRAPLRTHEGDVTALKCSMNVVDVDNVERTKELWSCDVLPFLFKKRNPCAKLFVLTREKFCWSETTSSSKCKDASHCVLLRGAVEGEEIISLSITQSSESSSVRHMRQTWGLKKSGTRQKNDHF